MEIRVKSDVLQEHILRNNMSQRRFAHAARLSCGYLTQLLTGKRNPSGSVREKLMQASGLEFDTLFRIVRQATNDQEGHALVEKG